MQDKIVGFCYVLILAIATGLIIGVGIDLPSDWRPSARICNAKGECAELLANNRTAPELDAVVFYGMRHARITTKIKQICHDDCFVRVLYDQIGNACSGGPCDMTAGLTAPDFEIQCKDAPFIGPCIHTRDGAFLREAQVANNGLSGTR